MEAGLLQATPLGYLLSGSPLLVLGPRASSESLPHRCKMSPLLRTKARRGGGGASLRGAYRTCIQDGAASLGSWVPRSGHVRPHALEESSLGPAWGLSS